MNLKITPALAEISASRDYIQTSELARALSNASQTIRKNVSLTGHYLGIRPIKIGNRLLWPVAEIAALLNEEVSIKNTQLSLIAGLSLAPVKNSTSKHVPKFIGTKNPRHLRVLHSLEIRPRKREDIDQIAGASNGPELIAELRRRGLEIPCYRAPAIDSDGLPTEYGIYSLSQSDRRKLKIWQRQSNLQMRRLI